MRRIFEQFDSAGPGDPYKRGNETTEKVQELLEQAKKSAHPLRDPSLERKIGEAIEHVKTKTDRSKG